MNETMIDILGVIISVIVLIFSGGLIGWLEGYRAGFRKATKPSEGKSDVYIPGLYDLAASRPDEIRCYRCGALSPTHYHGCPYAAQWCIETIAKPGG